MRDASFYEYDTTYFDWEHVDKYDNWLHTFDKLPDRMRLVVDLRMTRTKPQEISDIMNISVGTVKQQLDEARRRFLRGAKLI